MITNAEGSPTGELPAIEPPGAVFEIITPPVALPNVITGPAGGTFNDVISSLRFV